MVIDEKSEDRWRFHPHIVEYLIQIYKSPYQDTGHTEVGIKTWLPLLRFLWWCFKTIVETIHFKVRDKMTCGSTRLLFSCFFFLSFCWNRFPLQHKLNKIRSAFGKLILQAFCQSANAWGNGCSCFYICVLAGLKLWGFWVCKTHKYQAKEVRWVSLSTSTLFTCDCEKYKLAWF